MPIDVMRQNNDFMPRAYYSADITTFLSVNEEEIYRDIVHHSLQFDLTAQQEMAWNEQIRILKSAMAKLGNGYIAFEYAIPRMGSRIDNVYICGNYVFLIEFKVFENSYHKYAVDQGARLRS